MEKKKTAVINYSLEQIEKANRLLRLELTLARQYFAELQDGWQSLTPERLKEIWQNYFNRMIGGADMTNDNTLKERIIAAATTEGQGKAAYGCWLLLKSEGWERAREAYSKTSWYRHLATLRAAGLTDADISAGVVVPFRRKIFEARLVNDWSEINAA
jgi:II/X family phage/plasmid replication protein